MNKTLVVTPSVRAFPYCYFSGIGEKSDHIIIDDSKGQADRSELEGLPNIIFASREFVLDNVPPGSEHLFPTGNPSCKNFGLYWGWKKGYDVVVLLDDDVDTTEHNFMSDVPIGKMITATGYNSPSGWWNPMRQLLGADTKIYSRGYPYEYRGEPIMLDKTTTKVNPVFNQGLWVRTPDINGMDKAKMDPDYVGSVKVYGSNDEGKPWWVQEGTRATPKHIVLKPGQSLPMSIMNVQLARRAIPAFWQPPDFPFDQFRVRRHDDVWSMGFLKEIVDRIGDHVTVGAPIVSHMKAGDPIGEILSEHSTNLVQPYLFMLLSEMGKQLEGYPVSDYESLSFVGADFILYLLSRYGGSKIPGLHSDVLGNYFEGARAWSNLFI